MSQQRKKPQIESSSRAVYPFAAIVGQEEMKLALILNMIEPSVGGVLIMGHRGTGKSTVVRALADLLPEISSVADCVYGCDPSDEQNLCDECWKAIKLPTKLRRRKSVVPVVELPLGATEDRVCGTIDIEQALRSGVKRFEPGLLARANRGFLYIDEVNLLEDHLVDLLLDVAATGVNKVERESISVEHPARFVLIGSGNPEEGELRPQLLDRFGLYVEVKTEEVLEQRMEIVERRQAFARDSEAFRRAYANEQEQLRKQITRGRKSLASVKVDRVLLRQIVRLCSELKIDGHRGELTITLAARALAAFEGRKKVTESDVKRVTVMSLRHRLRRDLLEETASAERIEQALDKVFANDARSAREGKDSDYPAAADQPGEPESTSRRPSETAAAGKNSLHNFNSGANGDQNGDRNRDRHGDRNGVTQVRQRNPNEDVGTDTETDSFPAPSLEAGFPKAGFDKERTRRPTQMSTRFQSSRNAGKTGLYNNERGRYARSVASKKARAIVALEATLRATASLNKSNAGKKSLIRDSRDRKSAYSLRFKLFKRKQGRLFIFAIDLSGSMALNRIAQAKAVMVGLLRQSYIDRDTVAIVGFRGTSAQLLLPPSRSILRARRVLETVSVGGGTPLSAGLACSLRLAKRAAATSGAMTLLLFTDGQANVALSVNQIKDRGRRREIINEEISRLGVHLRKAGVTLVVADTQNEFSSSGKAAEVAEILCAEYRHVQGSNYTGRRV